MQKFYQNENPTPKIKDIRDEYLNKLSNDDTYTRGIYIDRPFTTQGNYRFDTENSNSNFINNKLNDKEKDYEKLLNNLNQRVFLVYQYIT